MKRSLDMFAHAKNAFYLFVPVLFLGMSLAGSAAAQTVDFPDGSKLDLSGTCPVCNMKVGGGKLGPAAAVFKDGKVVGFDGPGDFFRYLFAPGDRGFDPGNVKNLFVTDYATKKLIDAKQAFYVLGSDIDESMGLEAVPFSKKEDAEKYSAGHKGKKVAAYSEVLPEDLKSPKKKLKLMRDEGDTHKKH